MVDIMYEMFHKLIELETWVPFLMTLLLCSGDMELPTTTKLVLSTVISQAHVALAVWVMYIHVRIKPSCTAARRLTMA